MRGNLKLGIITFSQAHEVILERLLLVVLHHLIRTLWRCLHFFHCELSLLDQGFTFSPDSIVQLPKLSLVLQVLHPMAPGLKSLFVALFSDFLAVEVVVVVPSLLELQNMLTLSMLVFL